MTQQGDTSVIQRKALDGRNDFDARVMSPAKALRLSLAKVAERLYGLALAVGMVEQTDLSQSGIQGAVGDGGLLIVLDGAAGARAAVRLDPGFVTALIEIQVIGSLRPGPPPERGFTRTDAAMVQPLLDGVLDGIDQELRIGQDAYRPRGFRYGDMMEDARTLALALPEPEYDCFNVSLDIGEGARAGIMTLILPRRPEPVAAPGNPPEPAGQHDVSLARQVMDAPAVLDAVVARLRLPLHRICALDPGMSLPLGMGCLDKTRLIAAGGHVVGEAQLGQMNGLRAVRLMQEEDGADTAATPDPGDDRGADGAVPHRSGGDRRMAPQTRPPEAAPGETLPAFPDPQEDGPIADAGIPPAGAESQRGTGASPAPRELPARAEPGAEMAADEG